MPARAVISEVTPENFLVAVAERDRMRRALDEFNANGDASRLPSDAHEYYARLEKLEPAIKAAHRDEQRAEEYDRQMAETRRRGYEETRVLVGHTNGQKWTREELQGWTLQDLRTEATNSRVVVGARADYGFDDASPDQGLMSQDDYAHAYKLGGNQAVQEWYFEQKRELQLGRKYMPEQTQDGRELLAVTPKDVERAMRERQFAISSETAETVAFSAVEAGAAMNYLRGRVEEYNATREALIKHNPALEKDLPAALQVDEIRVRQVNIEHEESQDKGLAVAR